MAQEQNEQQEQNFHQFYYRYFINTKTPLIANDIYAVINVDKTNSLDNLVKQFLPEYNNSHEKNMKKADIEQKIIEPLMKTGSSDKFKVELAKIYLELKKENKQDAKEYFKNYEIDTEKPLQHKDIYAFLNKVSNSIEKLEQIIGKDLPAKMDKEYVINEIVKPIKQAGSDKSLKEMMVRVISLENKKNNSQKQVNDTVKNTFANHKVNRETPLWDKDIYAFLQQTGKEGRELLNTIVKKTTGKELPKGKIYKNMAVNDIVKPIKEKGKDYEMKVKGALVDKIEKVKGISQSQEEKQKKTRKI